MGLVAVGFQWRMALRGSALAAPFFFQLTKIKRQPRNSLYCRPGITRAGGGMPEVLKQLRERAASYRQLAKTALTQEGRKVFSQLAESYERAAEERSHGLDDKGG